jgi:hypothetical protein
MMRKKRVRFASLKDDGSDNKLASRLSEKQAMKAMKGIYGLGGREGTLDWDVILLLLCACILYVSSIFIASIFYRLYGSMHRSSYFIPRVI